MFNSQTPQKLKEQEGEKLIVNEPNQEYDQVFNNVKNDVDTNNIDKGVGTEVDQANVSGNSVNNNVLSNNLEIKKKELNIQDSDIHSMPDKFLKPEKTKKKDRNIFIILGIGLLILVIIAVGAFVFFALQGDNTANDQVLNLNDEIISDNEVEEDFSNDENLSTKKGRDLRRINDILEIRGALALYYQDIGKYPYYLSSLKNHLSKIPTNPEPGGEEYYYEIQDDGEVYNLSFVLEEGANFGNLILIEGKYELNSNLGLSPYSKSEPEEYPEEEPKEESEEDSGSGLLPIPQIGSDDDNDGLTNTEELLFGTKFALPDSDFDGYLDAEELIALYDPLTNGARLVDNEDLVSVYNNEIFNYSVLYPTQWSTEEKSSDFKEVVFYNDQNSDFFQIQIEDNPQGLTIQRWYVLFSPGAKERDLEYFENDNLVGVKTKDGFNIYIEDENNVYIISYVLIDTEELNYSKTFEMFSNSFKIINHEG